MAERVVVESEPVGGTVHIGPVDKFEEIDRLLVEVGSRKIAVFSTDDDFYALSNYCIHQGGPICDGLLSGTVNVDEEGELDYDHHDQIVSCPWHGWEFDVRDGTHLSNSAYRLPTFPVAVEDGEVYLDL